MTKSTASEFVSFPATTHRIELPPVLSGTIETIAVWILRRRQRQALAELDEHLLNDVGLSREQAHREANKPFWKR